MLREYLKSIADKLREKCGTTDKINAQDFTDKIDVVYSVGQREGYNNGYDDGYNGAYDVGYWKGYDVGNNDGYARGEEVATIAFWNNFNNNGNRTNCTRAFSETRFDLTTIPEGLIKPTADSNMVFYNAEYITIPKNTIDLSGVPRGTSTNCSAYNLFGWCIKLTEVQDLGLPIQYAYYQTYQYCRKLKTIEIIRCDKNTIFTNTFSNCNELESVTFEGEIGKSISFLQSPNLTEDTLKGIVDHLYDYSTEDPGTNTLTLHATAMKTLKNILDIHKSGSTYYQTILNKGWNVV